MKISRSPNSKVVHNYIEVVMQLTKLNLRCVASSKTLVYMVPTVDEFMLNIRRMDTNELLYHTRITGVLPNKSQTVDLAKTHLKLYIACMNLGKKNEISKG